MADRSMPSATGKSIFMVGHSQAGMGSCLSEIILMSAIKLVTVAPASTTSGLVSACSGSSSRARAASRLVSESIRNWAEVTTTSPASRPSLITTRSPTSRPGVTGTGRKRPSPSVTMTRGCRPSRISASRGIDSNESPSGASRRRFTNMFGFRRFSGLGTRMRTRMVRVWSSSSG